MGIKGCNVGYGLWRVNAYKINNQARDRSTNNTVTLMCGFETLAQINNTNKKRNKIELIMKRGILFFRAAKLGFGLYIYFFG